MAETVMMSLTSDSHEISLQLSCVVFSNEFDRRDMQNTYTLTNRFTK
jgi:hypothetical protein